MRQRIIIYRGGGRAPPRFPSRSLKNADSTELKDGKTLFCESAWMAATFSLRKRKSRAPTSLLSSRNERLFGARHGAATFRAFLLIAGHAPRMRNALSTGRANTFSAGPQAHPAASSPAASTPRAASCSKASHHNHSLLLFFAISRNVVAKMFKRTRCH